MIVIRSCCDNVFPKIRKDLFCRYLIYCPHCGFSIMGESYDEALEKWNNCQNGVGNDE